jgi:hypothetical protein
VAALEEEDPAAAAEVPVAVEAAEEDKKYQSPCSYKTAWGLLYKIKLRYEKAYTYRCDSTYGSFNLRTAKS